MSDLPASHDAECSRGLPYGHPGWRGLDPENCHRCIGLVAMLDAARDRRLAKHEELKRRIVGHLDTLPHGARGFTQGVLLREEQPQDGARIRLVKALRELEEDGIIAAQPSGGLMRYVIRGK